MTTSKLEAEAEQVREAGRLARERACELQAERKDLAVAVVRGEEGADASVWELDAELEELRRRIELGDAAISELDRRIEEDRRRRLEEDQRRYEARYDELVAERRELLKAVEGALDTLVEACGQALAVDREQLALGITGDRGTLSTSIDGRVRYRLAHSVIRDPGIPHREAPVPLHESKSDPLLKSLPEIRGELSESRKRIEEERAREEALRATHERRQRRELRRRALLAQSGIDSDSSDARRRQAERKADEVLRREFPDVEEVG